MMPELKNRFNIILLAVLFNKLVVECIVEVYLFLQI